jgi:hypothetical protein
MTQYQVGDRIIVSGLFTDSIYGPEATIVRVIPGSNNLYYYRIDNYPYNDGIPKNSGHVFSDKTGPLWDFRKAEFKYEASQEGDRDDDI